MFSVRMGLATWIRGSLEKNSEVTRMLHVGKSTIIALTPGAENLFKVSCNGTTQAGGKFPLSEKSGMLLSLSGQHRL